MDDRLGRTALSNPFGIHRTKKAAYTDQPNKKEKGEEKDALIKINEWKNALWSHPVEIFRGFDPSLYLSSRSFISFEVC